MASEVVVLDMWLSTFAMRVKIALAEKEVEFESREEDLSNKSPLLLEMNPVNKSVPVLIHKGKPICESFIIVEYIDEVWNHKSPLLPSDPYQRAHARFWADYIDKKIYPTTRKLATSADHEVMEAAKKELVECFKLLEGELEDKPYYGGDTFSFLDVALIPYCSFFHTLETLGNFSFEAECPKLVSWAKRCMLKTSVSSNLCDQHKACESILENRKRLGVE